MLLLHRSQPLLCSQALSFQKKESSYCLSCPSGLPVIRTWPAAFPPGPGNGCSARGSAAAGGVSTEAVFPCTQVKPRLFYRQGWVLPAGLCWVLMLPLVRGLRVLFQLRVHTVTAFWQQAAGWHALVVCTTENWGPDPVHTSASQCW